MNEKAKFQVNRVLLVLAIVSFTIATVEGVLFYGNNPDTPFFFKLLQIVQNSIKAFAFKPVISLSDAVNLMNEHHSAVYTVSCYAYGVAVFTAPYCTLTVVYKIFERFFSRLFKWRTVFRKEHILIFGYNDDVRNLLGQEDIQYQQYCIRIVWDQTIPLEEKYALSKKGIHYHEMNMLKASHKQLPYLLHKFYIHKAKHILLFEASSIKNYSLLQMFPLSKSNADITMCPDAKVICRCEDDGVAEMVSEYYNPTADNHSTGSRSENNDRCYDLEIISIPALQVSSMFENVSLHSCYLNKNENLNHWSTHILIAGFGAVGQQIVLQSMNLSVVSPENSVVIDVFDQDIGNKAGIFAARFSDKAFDIADETILMKSGVADGHLAIRFFKCDVRSYQFIQQVQKKHKELPYSYAAVTMDEIGVSAGCANQLAGIFDKTGYRDIPIVIRMDSDRRLADYIQQIRGQSGSDKKGPFPDRFQLLTERSKVLTLKNIIHEDLNEKAKGIHHHYSSLKFANHKTHPTSWNSLPVLKRESNRALAAYVPMWDELLKRKISKAKTDSDMMACMQKFFESGKYLWLEGDTWHYKNDDQLIKALHENEVMLFLTMTEHRRWCYFMASKGWGTGHYEPYKEHPCLVPYSLLERNPQTKAMVKYDFLPFMKKWMEICSEKNHE